MSIRIAMWSGPRNISTAMMRAWENRPDTSVVDEPLYAHYLLKTGLQHPGRDEVIAAHDPDWRRVVERLTGPIPPGPEGGPRSIGYQKHMTHHLLSEIDRGWIARLCNAFLIREPSEMLVSLAKVTPNPTLADTGLPQQVELFEAERARLGRVPPVIDSRDVLEDPRGMLEKLCAALGVGFDDRMLRWPAGPRASDGVWARHWYASVEKSTGFERYTPRNEPVPDRLRGVLDECRALYRALAEHRLRPA